MLDMGVFLGTVWAGYGVTTRNMRIYTGDFVQIIWSDDEVRGI